MFSPATFYAGVRNPLGPLTTPQVAGFDLILAEGSKRRTPTNFLADILATTWWETGKTMQPVREAFYMGTNAEAWRKKNLRYYPYYGRGLVQLTWEFNYRKATAYFQNILHINVDFVKNPDDVLISNYAVIILFEGMLDGWFTTKKLSDFIDDVDESDDEDMREFIQARRVINGTDKAETIAKIAIIFERALRNAGWSTEITPTPEPTKPVHKPIAPQGIIQALIDLFMMIFGKKGK